jgi:cystathionine beta-lyase
VLPDRLPEIIAIPIQADLPGYLEWISQETYLPMIYDFDTVIDRQCTECGKWNSYGDALPLWVADMDFKSPQPVIDALHERVAHGIFGYPDSLQGKSQFSSDFRQVLLERFKRLYHWEVKDEDLVLTPGVVSGLNMAVRVTAGNDAGVLIQPPVYPPFLNLAENAGAIYQAAPLQKDSQGSYSIDWDGLEAAFTPQTRTFVLCNPHNPVGRVFRRDELEKLAALCLEKGVTFISDEIHCDLLFSGQRHIPIASLDKEVAQNTITLMAPSKTFNLAGLGCSLAVIPDPKLREPFLKAQHTLMGGVNLMGLVAAEAAYRHGQEWLEQVLVYLEGNRDFTYEFVQANLPGVKMAKPEATYLAWLDCREADLSDGPYKFFLKEAKVALGDGKAFGTGGEGFVRLNFGCPRMTLQEGLKRMQAALTSHKQAAKPGNL